jgi:hypothetical protein
MTIVRFVTGIAGASLLSCGSVFAQVSVVPPAVGMTSPLGIGPASPVSPTGIPLGATELASPGESPLTAATSPLGSAVGVSPACRGFGGSIAESSFGLGTTMAASGTGTSSLGASGTSTSAGVSLSSNGGVSLSSDGGLPSDGSPMTGTSYGTGLSSGGTSGSSATFDGGGMVGSASGTCLSTTGGSLAGPAASASSPGMSYGSNVARVGIPMGSTELGAGGLSPMPTVPSMTWPTLNSLGTSPCPTGSLSASSGMSATTGMSTSSGSC